MNQIINQHSFKLNNLFILQTCSEPSFFMFYFSYNYFGLCVCFVCFVLGLGLGSEKDMVKAWDCTWVSCYLWIQVCFILNKQHFHCRYAAENFILSRNYQNTCMRVQNKYLVHMYLICVLKKNNGEKVNLAFQSSNSSR